MSEFIPLFMLGDAGMGREAESALATTIGQFFAQIRTILAYILEYLRRFLSWAGEHPLATTLFVSNLIIWMA